MVKEIYIERLNKITHELEKGKKELDRKYVRDKESLDRAYFSLGAFPIFESLEKSRQLLMNKSYLTENSPRDLTVAQQAVDFLLKLGDDSARKTALDYLRTKESEKVMELINLKLNEDCEDTITSYMSQGQNSCLLVLPSSITPQSTLEQKLSDWMLDLLTIDNKISNSDGLHDYKFKADFYQTDFPFLVYTISSQNPLMVCDSLIGKLNDQNVSPKDFKLVGLNHVVQKVDSNIFNYLLGNSFESIQKTYQKAQVEFNVAKPKNPTHKEILQKVQEITSPISKESLANILNLTVSGVSQRMNEFIIAPEMDGKKILITPESILAFVKGHRFTGKIWMKE